MAVLPWPTAVVAQGEGHDGIQMTIKRNSGQHVLPLVNADGSQAELVLTVPEDVRHGLFWIPALGVPMRHYQALADALAAHGIATARHEWRGCGSSNMRARRGIDWGYAQLLQMDLPASWDAARSALPTLGWSIGGHSLGAQFATMFAALNPAAFSSLVLVAGGTPWWRNFSGWRAASFRVLLAFLPLTGALVGHFPGRRVGFGGNEARSVMNDWAASARSGHYSIPPEIESHMATLAVPLLAMWLADDLYVPRAAHDDLLGKLPNAVVTTDVLDADAMMGAGADHFSWMKSPQHIARRIAQWTPSPAQPVQTSSA